MNSDGEQTPIYCNEPQWQRQVIRKFKRFGTAIQVISAYCFTQFNAVVLSSSGKWLFCTNIAFTEGSFGSKLRGNLLVTEAINPEEIQWWSYLRRYWLRCWPVLLCVNGKRQGRRACLGEQYSPAVTGRLSVSVCSKCVHVCACVYTKGLMVLQRVSQIF